MHTHIYLSIYLSIYLYTYIHIYLSIYLSIYIIHMYACVVHEANMPPALPAVAAASSYCQSARRLLMGRLREDLADFKHDTFTEIEGNIYQDMTSNRAT